MLNNITNFFNLIQTGMVKSQLESADLLPVGTRDSRYGGSYKPTMVKYSDLAAQILAGVPPLTIGITPIASGTAGKLLYEGAGNVLNESPIFNIDPLTGFLGAGTNIPQFAIDMQFSTLGFYSDPTYNAYFGLNNGGLYLSSHTRFVFNTSLANSALTIEQSGNILINTVFDAGYKLDVNGTARVSATDVVSALSITAPTRAIYFTTSAAGGTFNAISAGANGASGSGNFGFVVANGWSWNLSINNTASSSFLGAYLGAANDGQLILGVQTSVASSLLTINSTIKGFLPPRQTQAQRTAIVSPAVGLMVYQTDATEGLYIYKSTGWALNS